MTHLTERLAELRRHLDHLHDIRPRVSGPEVLERDLSLHNDVLFSLLTVCQLVIDISAGLAARRGDRFEDYTEAVRMLTRDDRFPDRLVHQLERLPGFRDVLVHNYVALVMRQVVEALDELAPVELFAQIVAQIEAESRSTVGRKCEPSRSPDARPRHGPDHAGHGTARACLAAGRDLPAR